MCVLFACLIYWYGAILCFVSEIKLAHLTPSRKDVAIRKYHTVDNHFDHIDYLEVLNETCNFCQNLKGLVNRSLRKLNKSNRN